MILWLQTQTVLINLNVWSKDQTMISNIQTNQAKISKFRSNLCVKKIYNGNKKTKIKENRVEEQHTKNLFIQLSPKMTYI